MILLDTHVLIWLALSPKKLSQNARNAILKSRMGKSFVRECIAKMRVLPISPEIAARAVSLPQSYPKDPQDRLIGATALVEGLELVTHDRLIRKSGIVPVIW